MLLADPIKDSEFDWQLTAIGRLRTFKILIFSCLKVRYASEADIELVLA